jgi:hypothetical protein
VLVNNKFAVKRSRSSPAAKPASFGAVLNKKRKPFSFSDGRGDRADSYNDSYSHGISGHSSFPAPDSRGPFVTTSGIADEPNFRKTFFALVFMASSLIATALFGIIAEMRVPNPKKYLHQKYFTFTTVSYYSTPLLIMYGTINIYYFSI